MRDIVWDTTAVWDTTLCGIPLPCGMGWAVAAGRRLRTLERRAEERPRPRTCRVGHIRPGPLRRFAASPWYTGGSIRWTTRRSLLPLRRCISPAHGLGLVGYSECSPGVIRVRTRGPLSAHSAPSRRRCSRTEPPRWAPCRSGWCAARPRVPCLPHLHRDWGSPRHICTAARLKVGRPACAHANTRAHTHGVRRARTGHARMLGYDLQHVQVLPLVCVVVCTVTEFSSNVAIANIVLPILKEQVAANAQWGLFQVVTCSTASVRCSRRSTPSC